MFISILKYYLKQTIKTNHYLKMGTNSPMIKAINRQTSIQTIGIVFIANLVLAMIYYKTLYVRQASIDTTKLDAMVMNKGERLCLTGARDSF